MKKNLPGISFLLRETWKHYKRNFKILAILSFAGYISSLVSSNNLSFFGGIDFKSSVLYAPIIIVAIVISFWLFVATLYAIKDEKDGIDTKEALSKGLRKLVPNLWVLILSIFIFLGGFFLFIIPGIIFLVWFYMSNFVLVTENVGGMSALLKSREYIRGYFWPVAGRLSLFWIITLISLWVPSYLFELFHLPLYVNSIYSAIISIITTPFYIIYGFILYKHLKSIKGEIALKSSSKVKAFFIICGILGSIIPIILIIVFLFSSSISSDFNTSQKSSMTQFDFKLENPLSVNREIVESALKAYHSDHGFYPSILEELVPTYLSSIPLNPYTKKQYGYILEENGKWYKICQSENVCFVYHYKK